MQVLKGRKHLEALLSDVEELEVGLDLILGLFAELHLFLLALAESREGVLIIEVCLLPEHPQEGALPFLPLIFPVLLID